MNVSAVRPAEEGKASGTNNSIREVGGVLGVAVLASIFARYGGYQSPQTFADGLVPALWVGAAVLALGSVVSLVIPRKRRSEAVPGVETVVLSGDPARAEEDLRRLGRLCAAG